MYHNRSRHRCDEVVDLVEEDDDIQIVQAVLCDSRSDERNRDRTRKESLPVQSDLDTSRADLKGRESTPLSASAPQCKVVLILDTMERIRRSASNSAEKMGWRMREEGIECDVRPLPCGDALFVARYADGTEVVLDYLIERKTLEDFFCSQKDGRAEWQSYLMCHSKISKRLFVLEGDMRTYPEVGNDARLRKKIVELELYRDIYVKRTRDLNDTACFYASMFRRLNRQFQFESKESVLAGRSLFSNWKSRMSDLKTGLSLEQLFFSQLCQAKGVSKTTAKAILGAGYRTPQSLFTALDSAEAKNRDRLLSQSIGQVNARVSKEMSELFCSDDYGTSVIGDAD